MAPEVVRKRLYTPKADIWSFGCLVIEMMTAKHPWPSMGPIAALWKIASYGIPEIPQNAGEDGKEFLKQAFEVYVLRLPDKPEHQ